MSRAMKKRSQQSGFTLLEALVATMIMGVAVAGILSALAASSRNVVRLTQADRAVILARTKMDAILRVSESLRFAVIAECVEDQDVLTRLTALGVGYAQGFGIYQPHPLDKLAGT